jgi:hypothetical protein
MISKMLGMLGAASLLAGASAAAAQSAAPLSLAHSPAARAGAQTGDSGKLEGTGLWIVGGIVLALVIWGVIELIDDEDEAFPNSP